MHPVFYDTEREFHRICFQSDMNGVSRVRFRFESMQVASTAGRRQIDLQPMDRVREWCLTECVV